MKAPVTYRVNRAAPATIARFLRRCDGDFIPPLSERVQIPAYAAKIARSAVRFEAWSQGKLVGLVAAYCNDRANRMAFVTTVSVAPGWQGRGIGGTLVRHCVAHARSAGLGTVSLEVATANAAAIRLYEKNGFCRGAQDGLNTSMHLALGGVQNHG